MEQHRYGFLKSPFKSFINELASNTINHKATSAVINHCRHHQLTKSELNYLIKLTNARKKSLGASHPNYLFLKSLVSIYQNGLLSPHTIRCLEQARQQKHPGAMSLLAIAYTSTYEPEWLGYPANRLSRWRMWWIDRQGIQDYLTKKGKSYLDNYQRTLETGIALFKEAISHNDISAMANYAIFIIMHSESKTNTEYEEALAILNTACNLQDHDALWLRSSNFIRQYLEVNPRVLDSDAFTPKAFDQALRDIEKSAAMGNFSAANALRELTQHGYYKDNPDVKMSLILFYRHTHFLVNSRDELIPVYTKELKMIQKQNQGRDRGIEYLAITAFNHRWPFIFWRRKIVNLITNSRGSELTKLLTIILNDSYIEESERQYFFKTALVHLKPKLTQLLLNADFADLYLNYIDHLLHQASTTKDYEIIEQLYRRVPIRSPIAACINARLADAYYNDSLQNGLSPKEAYEVAKEFHQQVHIASSFHKANVVERGGFSLSFHKLIHKERQLKAHPQLELNDHNNLHTKLNNTYCTNVDDQAGSTQLKHENVKITEQRPLKQNDIVFFKEKKPIHSEIVNATSCHMPTRSP